MNAKNYNINQFPNGSQTIVHSSNTSAVTDCNKTIYTNSSYCMSTSNQTNNNNLNSTLNQNTITKSNMSYNQNINSNKPIIPNPSPDIPKLNLQNYSIRVINLIPIIKDNKQLHNK